MEDFTLQMIPDLNFNDEFPLVTESLEMHKVGVTRTEDLLGHFGGIFTADK